MLKLTTYRRDQFANLKSKLEEDGFVYVSIMELSDTQKLVLLNSSAPHRARRFTAATAAQSLK